MIELWFCSCDLVRDINAQTLIAQKKDSKEQKLQWVPIMQPWGMVVYLELMTIHSPMNINNWKGKRKSRIIHFVTLKTHPVLFIILRAIQSSHQVFTLWFHYFYSMYKWGNQILLSFSHSNKFDQTSQKVTYSEKYDPFVGTL